MSPYSVGLCGGSARFEACERDACGEAAAARLSRHVTVQDRCCLYRPTQRVSGGTDDFDLGGAGGAGGAGGPAGPAGRGPVGRQRSAEEVGEGARDAAGLVEAKTQQRLNTFDR
jgi:hypothetical protein